MSRLNQETAAAVAAIALALGTIVPLAQIPAQPLVTTLTVLV